MMMVSRVGEESVMLPALYPKIFFWYYSLLSSAIILPCTTREH